jgi:hypothetical protein
MPFADVAATSDPVPPTVTMSLADSAASFKQFTGMEGAPHDVPSAMVPLEAGLTEGAAKEGPLATATTTGAALVAVPPAAQNSAPSGGEFLEAADPACEQLDDKTDAHITEVPSQDKHPSTPSSAAKTGSSSKWQLSEVHHMSFDCVNWGLWMTSADIWQLEGLHNFMVLMEPRPGEYFRLNLGPHPSDPNFDSIVLELLKQHANSVQSTHVEFEGVHPHKESAVPAVPLICVEALDATRDLDASSGVAMATATAAAAALAAVPPEMVKQPAMARTSSVRPAKRSRRKRTAVTKAATLTLATRAICITPATLAATARAVVTIAAFLVVTTATTLAAAARAVPPTAGSKGMTPDLTSAVYSIQGVFSNLPDVVCKCQPAPSFGKEHSWSIRLGKGGVGPRGCLYLPYGILHICHHGRTFSCSKRLMKPSVVTPYRGCVINISSFYRYWLHSL